MDSFISCPQTFEQIGEAGLPFLGQRGIQEVWEAYLDDCFQRTILFDVEECGCPKISTILGSKEISSSAYVYQGVVADEGFVTIYGGSAFFISNGEMRHIVEVSRSRVIGMSLSLVIVIYAVLLKYGVKNNNDLNVYQDVGKETLYKWRKVRNSPIGQWMTQNYESHYQEMKRKMQEEWHSGKFESDYGRIYGNKDILYQYIIAYLQDKYLMTINYEEGQTIKFFEKEDEDKEEYDIFPPMMFCRAATEQSRKYICHVELFYRKGITADHPFIVWLLKNAIRLNQHFQRQFQQIIECLCQKSGKDIVKEFGIIREQLCQMSAYYGLDAKAIPHLSREDFWPPESDKEVEQECPF